MGPSKLSRDQRMLVLRMYAENYTPTEIKRELYSQHNISIHINSIQSTCKAERNKPFVENFRQMYLNRIKDEPIANKRIRINDMEKMRKKLMDMIDHLPVKTKSQRLELSSHVKRLTELFNTAREEMEKKPSLVAGVVVGDMSERSDEDLQSRKQELVGKVINSLRGGSRRIESDPEGAESEDSE